MKKNILILIAIIFILDNKISICKIKPDENIKEIEIAKILSSLNTFNNVRNFEFRDMILSYFPKISKLELDSLLIVAEPIFDYDNNQIKNIAWDSLFLSEIEWKEYKEESKGFVTAPIKVFIPDSITKTVVSIIKNPIYTYNNVCASFRLYTKDLKQKYYIYIDRRGLTDLKSDFIHYLIRYEDADKETKIIKYHDKETFFVSFLPYDYKCFYLQSIDSFSGLKKFLILNNRIYNVRDLLKMVRSKITDSEYLYQQRKQIESSDVDSFLTRIRR